MEILQLLCSRRYCPANIPQLNCQLNCSAISSQAPLQNSAELIVKVTLRLTVSQSVSLGVKPHLGFMTRYLLLELIALTVLVITSRHGPLIKHSYFTVAFVFIAAGTCLPNCCPEMGCIKRFIKNPLPQKRVYKLKYNWVGVTLL
jgi:hypothetical protein